MRASKLSALAEAALQNARARTVGPGHAAKSRRRFWTDQEEIDLGRLYPDTPMPNLMAYFQRPDHAIYGKAASMGLKRSDAYLASEHACRLRRNSDAGAAFRFQKGFTPWNKGMKGLQAGGRAAETQFKKGSKPGNWLPIGSTRRSKDGYLQRKITDTGYPPRDWVALHTLLWEEQRGPVPPGHCLSFKDGNKDNIELDNLELITRAERMRRNTIHRYPPELKETIRLLNKLKRTIETTDEK